ncbi:cysteine desulfurase [Inquilinus sp. CAU 1745]|uniref:cysteine desulfurase n=1 Tax=Inquilinus sp. CAU 1745 TaxID=3140369 RepID=UPI00325B7641
MDDALTRPAAAHVSAVNDYDLDRVRADFPILSREVYGKPLVYLDNGASAQKPRAVIEAITHILENDYANVHRGLHYLSGAATDLYEGAREKVRVFLNADSVKEIIFTKGATESINLVASSFGRSLREGDEIVVSAMEHHANIVPWQLLRQDRGIVLKVAPLLPDGSLDMAAFEALLGPRTRLVSIAHTSNVLGTVTPAAEIARLAHGAGAKVLFDGSQAAVHGHVDVRAIDADFYAFTGHKLYGPSGIGILYGKQDLLDQLPPYQGGGDMIRSVTWEETRFNDLPYKFEAGTPPIVEAIALGVAIDYVTRLGFDRIRAHENDLLRYATERLSRIRGLKIQGNAPGKAAIVSFTVDAAHPHDLATLVDRSGVAIRAGHHCAQPLMDMLDVTATARASFGLYNSRAEVDALAEAVDSAIRKLS